MLEKKVGSVILAAGFGQINPGIPKVLERFNSKRLLQYPFDEAAALELKPMVVVNSVGDFGQKIVCAMEEDYKGLSFAWQSGRRGPADALYQALPVLRSDGCTEVVAVFGDMPFISKNHIRDLVSRHLEGNADITISTWKYNPDHPLVHRMCGYANFCVDRISEDGSNNGFPLIRKYRGFPEEGAEVLSSVYVLNLEWFNKVFYLLPEEDKCDGYPKERHLPNLVEQAVLTNARVVNMQLSDSDVHEIVGVNTFDDWKELSAFAGTTH